MNQKAISIRPFIGSKDFNTSRAFYIDLGFNEVILGPELSLFTWQELGFYLQKAYVKDWIENTMVFFQIDGVKQFWEDLISLNLHEKYHCIKLIPIREESWGRECMIIDPAGNLLHFGEFH